jgi:hypothetical protein
MNTTLKFKCVHNICFEIDIPHIQHFRFLVMHYALIYIMNHILHITCEKYYNTYYKYYIAHCTLHITYNMYNNYDFAHYTLHITLKL